MPPSNWPTGSSSPRSASPWRPGDCSRRWRPGGGARSSSPARWASTPLRRGQARLDGLVGTGLGLVNGFLPTDAAAPPAEATSETAANLVAVDDLPADIGGPDSDHLAIPDYDNLSAFQVMPRLEALDPTDLDAVRAYEESTRGRRTILNKIAQLS